MTPCAKSKTLWCFSRSLLAAPLCATKTYIAYAWTEDHTLALELLQQIVHLPRRPTASVLKLNPRWDDPREEPRFEQLVVEAAKPISL